MTGIQELKSIEKTQAEIASSLGVRQPIVSEWLSGKRQVSVRMALKIEKVFGIARDSIRPDVFG